MAAGAKPQIACIGAAHVDRIARCAGAVVWHSSNPVSVAAAHGGVARNIAANLALLECDVTLASAVGDDADGRAVVATLRALGVETSHMLTCPGTPTASYTAVLGNEGELEIGLADMAIYDSLTPDHCARLGQDLASHALWLADANLAGASLAALAGAGPHAIYGAAVSPAKAPRLEAAYGRLAGVFANRAEAAVLSGQTIDSAADALAAGAALRDRGAGTVFITLGEHGAVVVGNGVAEAIDNPPTVLRDANGAGDAFAAGALDAIARGGGLRHAAIQGLALASLSAEEDGPVARFLDAGRLAERAAQIGQAA